MDNINIILAANIQKYRKKAGLTQEELADKLGVTFQAVSKWENAKSAPDILFLPTLADLFGCYIDELFSREVKTENHYDHCAELPWNDDDIIRGVVCKGKKILTVKDEIIDKFTFNFVGEAKDVKSYCKLSVFGTVKGSCSTEGEVFVEGSINGGCNAGDGISVGGSIMGSINCGDGIDCNGNIMGGINCGDSVNCKGNINGNIFCKKITANGDVTAEKIEGNVTCNSIKCDDVDGEINIV